MHKKIAILPGDGIGPEIMTEAIKVLDSIADRFNHNFEYTNSLVGGSAYDKYKKHLPKETLDICKKSDAILFGSVGGPVSHQNEPKWKNCEKNALLGLRKHFNLNVNLRPSVVWPELKNISILKPEIVENGFDVLIVRELTGGIYFGKHKTIEKNGQKTAYDEMKYSEKEIINIAHIAFQLAEKRNKKLTSVDKANVLDCSILWRNIVNEVSKDYPTVSLDHMYVDNAAMQLVKNPRYFDLILTGNMFGDILSDLASTFAGSLGLLGSASFNQDNFGMYEPSGGSAPDIAGQNKANPIGQIMSAAMLLKYSFNLREEADLVERSVRKVLKKNRTMDIAEENFNIVSTSKMGDLICSEILVK